MCIIYCCRSKERMKYSKIGRSTKRFAFFRIYLFSLFLHTCMFPASYFVRKYIWHQVLLMGYSVRLELTRAYNLNDFQLVMGLYRGHPPFFFECVYLRLLYPSLIFDVFVVVCVCCSGFGF